MYFLCVRPRVIWAYSKLMTAEPRGEQLRVVARTSSGISDHREGDWVSVQPTQGPGSLPLWTARQPSILWLNVKPGTAYRHNSIPAFSC